jgi:hypothetical protein
MLRIILVAVALTVAAPGVWAAEPAGPTAPDPLQAAEEMLARGDAAGAARTVEALLTRAEDLDRLDREHRLADALVVQAVAAAVTGNQELAVQAFRQTLAVDPGWRPTRRKGGVPPAAFTLFEEVLSQSGTRAPVFLRPSRGEAEGEVAVQLHDPKAAVAHLVLFARPAGERKYEKSDFRGAVYGAPHQSAPIPPFEGLAGGKPYVLEYYVEGRSYSNDPIIRLGTPAQPLKASRQAPAITAVTRRPKKRWYQNQWVWIVAGVVVVGAVVGVAFAVTRSGNPQSGPGLVLFRY